MIEIMQNASPYRKRRLLPKVSRLNLLPLCLTTLFLSTALPALSASDAFVCELLPDGTVKCRRPKSDGGGATLHNKDDLQERLKTGLEPDLSIKPEEAK